MASGAVRDPDDMVRYVLSPDGEVLPDALGKLPGRGVWVSADEASLRRAVKIGGFKRGFKAKAQTDADRLVEQTRAQLRRRLANQLTMARKAGRLVFGQSSVREASARGDVALRIEASDGQPDGRGKLRVLSLATARELELPDPKVVGCFTAQEIGEALGREPVVHAAMLRGPMTGSVIQSASRLSGFEPMVPTGWPDAQHEIDWPPRGVETGGEPPGRRPPNKPGRTQNRSGPS